MHSDFHGQMAFSLHLEKICIGLKYKGQYNLSVQTEKASGVASMLWLGGKQLNPALLFYVRGKSPMQCHEIDLQGD